MPSPEPEPGSFEAIGNWGFEFDSGSPDWGFLLPGKRTGTVVERRGPGRKEARREVDQFQRVSIRQSPGEREPSPTIQAQITVRLRGPGKEKGRQTCCGLWPRPDRKICSAVRRLRGHSRFQSAPAFAIAHRSSGRGGAEPWHVPVVPPPPRWLRSWISVNKIYLVIATALDFSHQFHLPSPCVTDAGVYSKQHTRKQSRVLLHCRRHVSMIFSVLWLLVKTQHSARTHC